MKKRFFALLLCLALCASQIPAAAAAEITLVPPPAADEPNAIVASGKCGESLRWELDEQGLLTLSGRGDMWDFGTSEHPEPPWANYRSRIKRLNGTGDATSIGTSAFSGCAFLESVTSPNKVKSIGRNAFSDCSSLKSLKLKNHLETIGAEAFYYCSSLESVTIPDGVTAIEALAFYNCRSLESVTFGKGVKRISGSAFVGCLSLREVVFLGNAPNIYDDAFWYDLFVARYPAGDTSWTDSARQGYGGFVLWVPDDGPRITLTAYDAESTDGAHFSGGGTLSGGVCPVTMSSYMDRAALAAVKDGDAYTRLPCTTDADGVHHFTFTADGDTELVLALKGDVNLDGQLKGTDGTMLKRAVLGSYSYPEDCKALCELVADLNGDGVIKGSEGTQIARAVLGTFTIPW